MRLSIMLSVCGLLTMRPGISAGQTLPSSSTRSPSAKWWQSASLKAELGLTEQQSAAVEEIFQANLPKLRATKEELDKLEATLSKLIETGADEAQVIQHIDRVEAARSEMSKARTLMLLRMRRVLSQDQRIKLTAWHERWERERRGERREH